MNEKIVIRNESKIVGMKCTAVQYDGDGSIGKLWDKFLKEYTEIENIAEPKLMYGISICDNYDSVSKTFTYMAGVEVSDYGSIPEGMTCNTLPARKYAVFTKSKDQKLSDLFKYIFGEWFAASGYEFDEDNEFELYSGIFKDPDYNEMTLYIPVK